VATKIAPTHLKVVAQSSQNRSPDPFRLDYASMTPAVKGFGRTYAPPSEDKKIRNDCSSAIPVGAQGSGHISAEANVTQNVSPETRRSSIRHFAGIPPGARNREFCPNGQRRKWVARRKSQLGMLFIFPMHDIGKDDELCILRHAAQFMMRC